MPFAEGDLVFARNRNYQPWPARITSVADSEGSTFNVSFYFTNETGVCEKDKFWHFNALTKYQFVRQNRNYSIEALDEIEKNPEISFKAVQTQ